MLTSPPDRSLGRSPSVDVADAPIIVAALGTHLTEIDELREWATHQSKPFDPAKMALVLLATDLVDHWYPARATRGHYWTRTQVNHLLTIDIANTCARHGIVRPDCELEVWLLISHLASTDRLHFDSDPIHDLLAPLRCAGLDADGEPFELDPFAEERPHCLCFQSTAKQRALGLEQ